jgi:hypothetical protein
MPTAEKRHPVPAGAKTPLRFGPAAVTREGPPSQDTHLLCLFESSARTVVEERRHVPRYRTALHRAWLGWWTAPGAFGTVPVHLDDISLGGAKLLAAEPLLPQQIVWLCLGVPDPAECVQAKVVAVTPRSEGDFIVRIAFGIPCPHNLYQAAICGAGRAASMIAADDPTERGTRR